MPRDLGIRIDVLQVPAEGFTLEFLSQRRASGNVTVVHLGHTWRHRHNYDFYLTSLTCFKYEPTLFFQYKAQGLHSVFVLVYTAMHNETWADEDMRSVWAQWGQSWTEPAGWRSEHVGKGVCVLVKWSSQCLFQLCETVSWISLWLCSSEGDCWAEKKVWWHFLWHPKTRDVRQKKVKVAVKQRQISSALKKL